MCYVKRVSDLLANRPPSVPEHYFQHPNECRTKGTYMWGMLFRIEIFPRQLTWLDLAVGISIWDDQYQSILPMFSSSVATRGTSSSTHVLPYLDYNHEATFHGVFLPLNEGTYLASIGVIRKRHCWNKVCRIRTGTSHRPFRDATSSHCCPYSSIVRHIPSGLELACCLLHWTNDIAVFSNSYADSKSMQNSEIRLLHKNGTFSGFLWSFKCSENTGWEPA